MKCTKCKSKNSFITITKTRTYDFKDTQIKIINIPYKLCTSCDELFHEINLENCIKIALRHARLNKKSFVSYEVGKLLYKKQFKGISPLLFL